MGAGEKPDDDWLVRGPGDAGEVAARYDGWAEHYDADLDAWSYRAPAAVAEALMAHGPAPESVLDVGCGTGLSGRALRERGFAGRLTGIDISEASLRVAERSGTYDHVEVADLSRPLEVDDASVGALVCVGVMTYLSDVEATWREFARVVRPGGLVVVTQREDLWEPRGCQAVIAQLQGEGVWTSLDVRGPAPYLPDAGGALADLGAYYVTARVG